MFVHSVYLILVCINNNSIPYNYRHLKYKLYTVQKAEVTDMSMNVRAVDKVNNSVCRTNLSAIRLQSII